MWVSFLKLYWTSTEFTEQKYLQVWAHQMLCMTVNIVDKLWSRSTEVCRGLNMRCDWATLFPDIFLCKHTKSSWVDAKEEERQYLQLRARVWKVMDKRIGLKTLKLLSGEGSSEEKKRLALPEQDQQDLLTSEGDWSPELLEENLVWGAWVVLSHPSGLWVVWKMLACHDPWAVATRSENCVQQIFAFYPKPLTSALSRQVLSFKEVWKLLFSGIAFWQALWELRYCAPNLVLPSAPFGAFAWHRVELSRSSSGSQQSFQLLPFPRSSTQSSWPEGWGWPVQTGNTRFAASQEFTLTSNTCCARVSLAHVSHPRKWQQCPTEGRAFSWGQGVVTRPLLPQCLPRLAAFPAWARLLRALLSPVPFAWLWLCVCFLSHTDSASFTAQNNKRFVERVLLSNLSSSFILSLFNVCFCCALNTKLLISL